MGGKALRSYHRLAEGLGTVPLALGLGRLASPRFRFTLLTCGVNGAPVRAIPVPANCQPRASRLRFQGATQEDDVVKTCPMLKSERPRSILKLRASCTPPYPPALFPSNWEASSMDLA